MNEKNLDLKFERETKLVKLSRSYEFEGQPIEEVTLQEPLVDDQLQADALGRGSQAMIELVMFSRTSGLPLEFFKGIATKDYLRLSRALQDFLD